MSDQFKQRLKAALGDQSARKFAAKIGVSPSSMVKYLSGENEPTRPVLEKIAEAANVSIAWLVSGDGRMRMEDLLPLESITAGGLYKIPRYDIRASAGGGAVVDPEDEVAVNDIHFPKKWLDDAGLNPKKLNAISVNGDSMEPTIPDGHMVLVDRQDTRPRSGNIYVLNYDGDLLVKRLQKLVNGDIEIISDNPRYRPETVHSDQLEQLRIVGRVVWHGGLMA